jgi:hypothetical protein
MLQLNIEKYNYSIIDYIDAVEPNMFDICHSLIIHMLEHGVNKIEFSHFFKIDFFSFGKLGFTRF